MDERVNRIAALANVTAYDSERTRQYVDEAPHVKHASLRRLYGELVAHVFDEARRHAGTPRVLDLGAGEGSVTLPFLELGAKVVAVDISQSQLDALKARCEPYGDMLETRRQDIHDALRETDGTFDLIVVNSFLHHVPDYIGLIREATAILSPRGQFFSFQDPLRYDSLGRFTSAFSKVAYFSWRIFKGDVIKGLQRRMRRARGVYLEDSMHDNAEYHVVRNGVDQDAISRTFAELGCDCAIRTYFSTQNPFFQFLGSRLGLKNTFAVIARKRD